MATYKMELRLSDGSTVDAGTFEVPQADNVEVPTYWQAAVDEGSEAINTALTKAGYNKSAFLFYSDAHWNYGSQMSPTLLKYLYRHTGMNKTFFGGDIVNNEADDYDTMAYLWDWRNQLKDLPNHHSVVGNHDDGNTTNNLFDEKYVYGYLLAAEETPDIVRGDAGLYYYIDSPAEKTRYLFLDTAFQTVLYDAVQAKFVVDALSSTPENWHIVALAHIWYNTDYNVTPPSVGDLSYAGTLLLDLFDKYNARGSGTLSIAASSTDATTTAVAYDFTRCSGKVEFCVGGHTHWDYDGASSGGIPVILVETDSQHVRSGLDYTSGTTTEASVNGIIADYDAGKITVVRIGRGDSRVVDGAETPATYTNVLKIATDKDGSLYNGGKGYKDGYRYSTSGDSESAQTGWDITGYISCTAGDVIRMKNVTFMDINSETTGTQRCSVHMFRSDKSYYTSSNTFTPSELPGSTWSPVYNDDGDLVQFTLPSSYGGNVAFIRMVGHDFNENSIITVNEEIV